MLILPEAGRTALERAALGGYPLEVCGFLIGEQEGGQRRVARVEPAVNRWDERPDLRPSRDEQDARRRYVIAPEDLLAAIKRARRAGQAVIGVYHSHPNHPAEPSERDRRTAWPEWSYVILSTDGEALLDLRSWRLDEDSGRFVAEPVREAAPAD